MNYHGREKVTRDRFKEALPLATGDSFEGATADTMTIVASEDTVGFTDSWDDIFAFRILLADSSLTDHLACALRKIIPNKGEVGIKDCSLALAQRGTRITFYATKAFTGREVATEKSIY
jgi:hypothetical protein